MGATTGREGAGFAHALGAVVFVAVVVVVQFAVAMAAARRPTEALAIVGGVALVASAVLFPRVVLVLALLATLFPQRVGPASIDLSVTDAMGVIGLLAALRFIPWRDPRVRLVLGGLGIYMGALAISLVEHHAQKSVLELLHRGVLFAAAVGVGIAIVQSGTTRAALRALMAALSVVAAWAAVDAARTGLQPAYVFDLQKNHAGVLLAAGFLVAYVAGPRLALPARLLLGLRVLMLVGLAATQSRAAIIGLVAALAVRPLLLGRRGNQRAASIGVLLLCVVMIGFTAGSISSTEYDRPDSQIQFNSINARTNVYKQALADYWRPNLLTGAGLKYFTDLGLGTQAAHNLIIGELAEVGVIGLGGLVALLGATAMALRRSPGSLALLGLLALVLRVTQGMAEIFWVAGPLTIALVLVGMGLTRGPDEDVPPPGGAAAARGMPSSRLPAQGRLVRSIVG